MGCTKQTEKKYTSRPGPPYPANECKAGSRRKGNDGDYYTASPNKNGVNTWKRSVAKRKSPAQKRAKAASGCIISNEKKYRTRPSPPYPANECEAWSKRKGNDGQYYTAMPNKNGVNTWRLI